MTLNARTSPEKNNYPEMDNFNVPLLGIISLSILYYCNATNVVYMCSQCNRCVGETK